MNSCAAGHPRIAYEVADCPLCAAVAWHRRRAVVQIDALAVMRADRDALSHQGRVNQAITDELVRENDRLRREHPGVPK